jgi:hypothetical protein
MRNGFLALGLGVPISDSFWAVGTSLLNGTPLPAAPQPQPQPTSVSTPVSNPSPTATPQTRDVILYPQSGPSGSSLSLQGTGFTPGQTATITFNRGFVSAVLVAPDGTIAAALVVPNVPAGVYLVGVTTPSDGTITRSFQVTSSSGPSQPTSTPGSCHPNCS